METKTNMDFNLEVANPCDSVLWSGAKRIGGKVLVSDGISMVKSLTDKVMVLFDKISKDTEERGATDSRTQFTTSLKEDLSNEFQQETNYYESINCTPCRRQKHSPLINIHARRKFCLGASLDDISKISKFGPSCEPLQHVSHPMSGEEESQLNKNLTRDDISIPTYSNIINVLNMSTSKRNCKPSMDCSKRTCDKTDVPSLIELDTELLDNTILHDGSGILSKDFTSEFENDIKFLSTCTNKTSTPDGHHFKKQYVHQNISRTISNSVPFICDANISLYSNTASQLSNGKTTRPMVSLLNRSFTIGPGTGTSAKTPVRRCLPFTIPEFKAITEKQKSLSETKPFRNEDEEAVYYLITKYLNNKDMKW